MRATFLDFEYIRQYYNSTVNLPPSIYGPYFPYRTVDPLISDLISNKKNGPITYWDALKGSDYGKQLFKKLHKQEYQDILKRLVKHGNNLTEFLHREIGKNFQLDLLSNEELYFQIKSLHRQYRQKEIKDKYLPIYLLQDYCGLLLFNCISNKERAEIKAAVELTKESSICKICGNSYSQIFIPKWVYYRANGNAGICYECPLPPRSRKSDLMIAIRELTDYIGFIPNTGFHLFEDNSFAVRISEDKWEKTFSLLLKFKDSTNNDVIKSKFGNWFSALVEAGILQDNQLKTARGIKCIANSGNLCNSLAEQFIDNWMYAKGIKAQKEPRYPFHPTYNTNGLMRADWFVNNFYIEYFGLKGELEYDEKTIRKINLINDLNLKLIPLYPEDLRNLEDKFKVLFDEKIY